MAAVFVVILVCCQCVIAHSFILLIYAYVVIVHFPTVCLLQACLFIRPSPHTYFTIVQDHPVYYILYKWLSYAFAASTVVHLSGKHRYGNHRHPKKDTGTSMPNSNWWPPRSAWLYFSYQSLSPPRTTLMASSVT